MPGKLSRPDLWLLAASVACTSDREYGWRTLGSHAFDAGRVVRKWQERAARYDDTNPLVTFSEANFGEAELSDADWAEFQNLWASISTPKLFLNTTRYGRAPSDKVMGRWRGFRHESDFCGDQGKVCKPNCVGCRRPAWGNFIHEGLWTIRHLGLEDRVNPSRPFVAPR